MKKIIITTLCLLSLTSASCSFFPNRTAGIMRTSNGGIDWQASNKLKDGTGSILNLSISKLAFDPQGSDVLYAGAFNAGIYASHDGASTWEQILGQIPVMDFVIHPNDNQTIYAAGYFEDKGRALVTHDGGKSWNAIYTSASTNSAVRTIALNPSSPEQIAIGMSTGELIMSNDGGASWRLVQSYNDRINKILWTYNGIYVVVKSTGISKSIDNGNSFQLITANLQSPGNTSTLAIFGDSVSSFNQLAISQSNPNTMYATTNLGLYRSLNGGNSWSFVAMPLRQSAVPPVAIGIAPSSDNVVYVSAGSVVYKTVDGGNSWSASETGAGNLVNALLVDPTLPQVSYAGVYSQ
ncbi:MAG TPA: hypothetical protein VHQ41_02930 [Patescibacteria group bacterium]|jgi:photosystem II stability/assembly factor-like uncharacterized protein|nr:hypothetical protein [Patescibacteria group bacterium]